MFIDPARAANVVQESDSNPFVVLFLALGILSAIAYGWGLLLHHVTQMVDVYYNSKTRWLEIQERYAERRRSGRGSSQ